MLRCLPFNSPGYLPSNGQPSVSSIVLPTWIFISVLSPVFMFLFISSQGYLSFVFLVLLGLFVFAPGPVLLALVQDREKEKPMFANSIYMTISFVTASIAVVLAGFIGDWVGLEQTYKISAFLAVGAIPFVLMLKTK